MNVKYMNELKNEIVDIITLFNTNSDYKYQLTEKTKGAEYFIILKNGVIFWIAPGSCTLPEFTEEDIIYIRKKMNSNPEKDSDNYFEKHIDSEIGIFKITFSTEYDYMIMKLFGTSIENSFDTGCYN